MSIGGTVAYLTARSNTATNTFTVGSIGSLVLEETGLTAENRTNEYTVAPGVNITKDPWVSYTHSTANPVDVYVYVTIAADTPWEFFQNSNKYAVQSAQVEDQLSWTVAEGWTYLTTESGKQVYYRAVAANATLSHAPSLNAQISALGFA